MGEICHHRGAKPGPERIGQNAQPGNQYPLDKRQWAEHRHQSTSCGEVNHQADAAADDVRHRHDHLAGSAVPGMKDLGQGVRLGRQLAKAFTKGIDEQDHQRAPEAVVQRPRQTVFKA
ncbi:hypothetical protein D3C77_461640 [compost metagenome]